MISRRMLLLLAFFCVGAESVELTVVFGQSRPPFVDEQRRSGISVMLFNAVAERLGWQYQAVFASNRRMEKLLKDGKVDVAVEVQPTDDTLFYSQPFIAYHNYAFHRQGEALALSNMDDLKAFSVCAWQNASQQLGLQHWTTDKADYWEYPEQKWQVADWLVGRCEVILIDDTLLNWHLQQFSKRLQFLDIDIEEGLKTKALLPVKPNPLWFYVGFTQVSLRDAFDKALSRLKESGRYQRIRHRYTKLGESFR